MTQEELEKKAEGFADKYCKANITGPTTGEDVLPQAEMAAESGYKQGYQDAQSEVKDTAIAFAEWFGVLLRKHCEGNTSIIFKNYGSNPDDLYDLFLASQNK